MPPIGKIDIDAVFIIAGMIKEIIEVLDAAFFLKRFPEHQMIAEFSGIGIEIGDAVAFSPTLKHTPNERPAG